MVYLFYLFIDSLMMSAQTRSDTPYFSIQLQPICCLRFQRQRMNDNERQRRIRLLADMQCRHRKVFQYPLGNMLFVTSHIILVKTIDLHEEYSQKSDIRARCIRVPHIAEIRLLSCRLQRSSSMKRIRHSSEARRSHSGVNISVTYEKSDGICRPKEGGGNQTIARTRNRRNTLFATHATETHIRSNSLRRRESLRLEYAVRPIRTTRYAARAIKHGD